MTRGERNQLLEARRLETQQAILPILAEVIPTWKAQERTVNVGLGAPRWKFGSRLVSKRTKRRYHWVSIWVANDWLEMVFANGLAILGYEKRLCLKAEWLPPPENAEAAWQVTLLDTTYDGCKRGAYVVRFAGLQSLSFTSKEDGYQQCLGRFQLALEGVSTQDYIPF